MPSFKSADCPFSVFSHFQSVSSFCCLRAVNIFVGAKILFFIDLSKYSSHFLHPNTIIVGAVAKSDKKTHP